MGAVDDRHRVHQPLEADVPRLEEAHDHARRHRVADPLAQEEVLPAAVEGHLGARGVGGDRLDLGAQLWGHALVGVEVEDPRVAEGDGVHRPVLVGRPVVEGALDHAGALGQRDLLRAVLAQAVEDDDIVEPRQRVEAGADVGLFVEREDEDGDRHGGRGGADAAERLGADPTSASRGVRVRKGGTIPRRIDRGAGRGRRRGTGRRAAERTPKKTGAPGTEAGGA